MASTKHFVIDPNGVKHTRVSKTRVYAFAVVARPSFYANMAAAEDTRTDRLNFAYYTKRVAEGTRHTWEPADQLENFRTIVETYKTADAYAEAMVAKRIQALREKEMKGFYTTYEVLGWTSRRDLAMKLIMQFRTMTNFEILPAQIEA